MPSLTRLLAHRAAGPHGSRCESPSHWSDARRNHRFRDPDRDGRQPCFFFSSRRRHTRCSRDWSSDVCSSDLLRRNFGMAHPEGYRKALRLMHLAEQFHAPVITLVDTPGAYPGLGAEERGQAEAIARNLVEMATLRTPTLAAVIGEGGSGGALAVGLADRVLMLENSADSVI